MKYIVTKVAYKDNNKSNGIIALWSTFLTTEGKNYGYAKERQVVVNEIKAMNEYYTQHNEKITPIKIYTKDNIDYLRTDANEIAEDNLGELDTFIYTPK